MSRRLPATLAVVLALATSTACYRVTVVTGAAPAAPIVDKPWATSFVAGLVPPQPVNVAGDCPGGVSRVVTQRRRDNQLLTILTAGIYSPMTITVTCAAGPRPGAATRP